MPTSSVSPISAKVARKQRPKMVSDAGVEYEIVTVTPGQAELWLAKNTDNRRIRRAAVSRYSRDIVAGTWSENGSAIVFADDGTLLDGQHRLEACVVAHASFDTLVVRGVARTTQNTIDDGAKRTLADRFTFSGHANASAAAAICRRILMWDAGFTDNRGTYQPTTHEALDLIDRDPTVKPAIECAVGMRNGKLLPPSIVGLCWWLFWAIDEDACQEFWTKFSTGADLYEGNPILVLRDQVARKAHEPGRIPETVILAWVIKAWNDARDVRLRQRPYSLRPGERFPVPK